MAIQQQQQNNSKENTNIINQCSNLSNEITSIGMASGTGQPPQPPASASASASMATTTAATGTSTTAQISQQHNNQVSTNQLTTTLNQQSQSITSSQHNLASHSPAKNVAGGGGGGGTGGGVGGSSVGGNGAAAGTSGATVAPAAIIQNNNPQVQVTKRKETLEAKRERKAAKTLAIITGAFVVCWLPFFLMALLLPLCETCNINDSIASLFLWLGYFNSTLNPVIYTIFSPEFRQAFKRILFGSHNSYYRRGKL